MFSNFSEELLARQVSLAPTLPDPKPPGPSIPCISSALCGYKTAKPPPAPCHSLTLTSDTTRHKPHGSPVPRLPCLREQEPTRSDDGAAAAARGGEADHTAARADQGAHLREPVPVHRPQGTSPQGRRQEQRWQQPPPRFPRWLMRFDRGEITRRIKMRGCHDPR